MLSSSKLIQKMSDNERLQLKLKSALRHVLHTVVIGASNKIDDLRNTNLWVFFLSHRYDLESDRHAYKKQSECLPSVLAKAVHMEIDAEQEHLKNKSIKNYYFNVNESYKNPMTKFTPINPFLDPLNDPLFKLDDDKLCLFLESMNAYESRSGNCGSRSHLLSKYLWENNQGINRIEFVFSKMMDHAFVIVNRSGDLNNSATWGDAWIIDSWYENGIIFPASQFAEQFEKIKAYVKKQIDEQTKIGVRTMPCDDIDKKHILFSAYDIKPNKDLYPTYSKQKSFLRVEEYYDYMGAYPLDPQLKKLYNEKCPMLTAFDTHKNAFNGCLFKIRELNTNDDTIKNEENFPNKKVKLT